MKKQETEILINMSKDIGKLIGKVDKINGSIANHETRINTNESKMDTLLGKVSIVGSIGVFLGGLVMWALNYLTKQ